MSRDHGELAVTIDLVGFFLPNDVGAVPVPNVGSHFDFDFGAIEKLDFVDAALTS